MLTSAVSMLQKNFVFTYAKDTRSRGVKILMSRVNYVVS